MQIKIPFYPQAKHDREPNQQGEMQINIRNVERFLQLICIKRWRPRPGSSTRAPSTWGVKHFYNIYEIAIMFEKQNSSS